MSAFWEERIVLHEVSFRSASERSWAVFADSREARLGGAHPCLCECGDRTCTQVVHVPLQLYAEAREHPARFLIVPGHRQLDSETIVDDGDAAASVLAGSLLNGVVEERDLELHRPAVGCMRFRVVGRVCVE